MIKKILIDIRDICYVYLTKKKGELYAKQSYKFLTKLIFAWYYLALLFTIFIILNKTKYYLPIKVKESFLLPVSLLIIYNVILEQVLKKISMYPIDAAMNENKYKKLGIKAVIVIFIGMLLLIFSPWMFDKFLPDLR